jgi:hypothetical protein
MFWASSESDSARDMRSAFSACLRKNFASLTIASAAWDVFKDPTTNHEDDHTPAEERLRTHLSLSSLRDVLPPYDNSKQATAKFKIRHLRL